MIRAISMAALLAASGSVASAAFLGIQVREDKVLNLSEDDLAIVDPMGLGVRAFNIYAKFDGAGSAFNAATGSANDVLSVGQNSPTDGFGINKSSGKNASAYIFNATEEDLGGLTPVDAGSYSQAQNNGFGVVRADTYFSVGRKIRGTGTAANATSGDNDFAIIDTGADADGLPDFVRGGWFNASPPNRQGSAQSSNGKFETFLGQVVLVGLDAGARIWAGANGEGGAAPNAASTWYTDIFTGTFTVFRQGVGGEPPAVPHVVTFNKPVPTPGAMALFGIAGLAAARRRRA